MLHLTRQLLTQSFLTLGYSPLDYLYTDQIQKSLQQLNQQQFDTQTLQQLLNQCTTNSRGQIKLQDLMMTFTKAENILVQRDIQIRKLVKQLSQQLNDKQRNKGNNLLVIQELQSQLYEAKEEHVSNTINLQIIRKPFMRQQQKLTSPRTPKSPAQQQQQPLSAAHRQSPSQFASVSLPGQGLGLFTITNTHSFTWILQLSCLLLLITLPCMFYVPCYVNIILLLLIALNMISGYFCRYLLRAWMYLVILSVLIDIVWYIVAARQLWIGTRNYPNYINSYIRLTLVLNCLVDVGKIVLFFLLMSQYNVDQSERRVVSIFGLWEIDSSHDQGQKNMFFVLNKCQGNNRQDHQQF